jgi:hypothetical protein
MPLEMHIHLNLDSVNINVVHTMTADAALSALIQSIKEDISTMSTDVNSALLALQADVTQETTVDQSAITLIQGIPALIAAAVAAAQAAGATPAQLASFDQLGAQITANATGLAAAVTAGTPAATPAKA